MAPKVIRITPRHHCSQTCRQLAYLFWHRDARSLASFFLLHVKEKWGICRGWGAGIERRARLGPSWVDFISIFAFPQNWKFALLPSFLGDTASRDGCQMFACPFKVFKERLLLITTSNIVHTKSFCPRLIWACFNSLPLTTVRSCWRRECVAWAYQESTVSCCWS